MYTGPAQADVTTAAVNIIIMSLSSLVFPDVHYTYGGVSPISGKHG